VSVQEEFVPLAAAVTTQPIDLRQIQPYAADVDNCSAISDSGSNALCAGVHVDGFDDDTLPWEPGERSENGDARVTFQGIPLRIVRILSA